MIHYVKGDATRPDTRTGVLLCHVVNDIRAWGAGFTRAVTARWPHVEEAYRAAGLRLGETQIVAAARNVYVANICAQAGLASALERTPLRYDALQAGLLYAAGWCDGTGFSAHMPKLGAGLAGGDWSRIELLIKAAFGRCPRPVWVYAL